LTPEKITTLSLSEKQLLIEVSNSTLVNKKIVLEITAEFEDGSINKDSLVEITFLTQSSKTKNKTSQYN
jgi:hypothetical protein